MVLLTTPEHGQELCRVQKMSVTEKDGKKHYDLNFRLHAAATIENPDTLRRIRTLDPGNVEIQKVVIDPLGRRRPAHD
jgi:hypothetical protein